MELIGWCEWCVFPQVVSLVNNEELSVIDKNFSLWLIILIFLEGIQHKVKSIYHDELFQWISFNKIYVVIYPESTH